MLLKNRNITKKERIKSTELIKYIFSHSKPCKFDGMSIFRTQNSFNFNRFCILTKKGFGFSFIRNRERRIIREVYRNLKNQFKSGYDFIFLLYPRSQISSFKGRSSQIKSYITQLNSLSCS